MDNIDEIISSFDKDDHDLATALIPFFIDSAWEEYNRTWHILGNSKKDPDFQFILGEKIWDFLNYERNITLDLDAVCKLMEDKFGTYEQ